MDLPWSECMLSSRNNSTAIVRDLILNQNSFFNELFSIEGVVYPFNRLTMEFRPRPPRERNWFGVT